MVLQHPTVRMWQATASRYHAGRGSRLAEDRLDGAATSGCSVGVGRRRRTATEMGEAGRSPEALQGTEDSLDTGGDLRQICRPLDLRPPDAQTGEAALAPRPAGRGLARPWAVDYLYANAVIDKLGVSCMPMSTEIVNMPALVAPAWLAETRPSASTPAPRFRRSNLGQGQGARTSPCSRLRPLLCCQIPIESGQASCRSCSECS